MKNFKGFMHGVNFGGWLSQRSYDKEYLDSFITEADFKRVSEWDIDHLRIPVDYNVVETEDGEYKESGFEYISNAINWCRKYGLNMILDLHKCAGFVFDNPDYVEFFENEALQERFYKLWEEFARRFGGNSDMLVFELLNEVTDPKFSDTWNKAAKTAIKRIRAIAPDIRIIVGGYWNASIDAIYDLEIPEDKNVIFTFHCYDPLLFTHQKAYWVEQMRNNPDFSIAYPGKTAEYRQKAEELGLAYMMDFKNIETETITADLFINRWANAVKYCEEHDIALYCGEYGVIDKAPTPDTVRWYKDINTAFEHYGIGRAAWSYKEVDYGIIDDHYKDIADDLIKLL